MTADTTVEFGEDGRRARLIDRLFGDPATSPERRLSVPAVVCAAISVVLFAVAQAVPWLTIESITLGNSVEPATQVISSTHKTSVEAAGDAKARAGVARGRAGVEVQAAARDLGHHVRGRVEHVLVGGGAGAGLGVHGGSIARRWGRVSRAATAA